MTGRACMAWRSVVAIWLDEGLWCEILDGDPANATASSRRVGIAAWDQRGPQQPADSPNR